MSPVGISIQMSSRDKRILSLYLKQLWPTPGDYAVRNPLNYKKLTRHTACPELRGGILRHTGHTSGHTGGAA